MKPIVQEFAVRYQYHVHFTTHVFAPDNLVLAEILRTAGQGRHKVLCIVDEGLAAQMPGLVHRILTYHGRHKDVMKAVCPPLLIPGGEMAKNSLQYVDRVQAVLQDHGICRQSFVVAIGGGALLDMVGFAAAITHRGVRLIRIPTTALSQDDSGVGVKNGVNRFDKKNFTGTFAPPYAVINDFAFLETLEQRDWISGLAEAVKVALLKDAAFFSFLEMNAKALVARDGDAMRHAIYRCAELHIRHIGTAGDPFESSSSRPLDFGHWAAHKLELLTNFRLRHGEAVAIGIALDSTYSFLRGILSQADWLRILSLLSHLGFTLYVSELESQPDANGQESALFRGLEEFREHLGGELTLTLLQGVGNPVEVHSMDHNVLRAAIRILREGHWATSHSVFSKEVLCELDYQLRPESGADSRRIFSRESTQIA
jgi:3-dehydroquinate synthase